jgi:UDP-galactopyranose mutase
MEKEPADITYIHTEYPLPYNKDAEKGNIPYYPVFTDENQRLYSNYVEMAKAYPNLILLGRLAEYKYYNMDAIVEKALLKAGNIV